MLLKSPTKSKHGLRIVSFFDQVNQVLKDHRVNVAETDRWAPVESPDHLVSERRETKVESGDVT